MVAGTVEFDFFGMEKVDTFPKPPAPKLFERKRSFRDIQGMISKINPQVVKAVISGSANAIYLANCNDQSLESEKKNEILASTLPLYNPMYSHAYQTGEETAPMTIFYNGVVAVFDVPHQLAVNTLKVAEAAAVPEVECRLDFKSNLLVKNGGLMVAGLPLTHRKSLRRFLQKRKQRQTNTNMIVSCDNIPNDDALSLENASSPVEAVIYRWT